MPFPQLLVHLGKTIALNKKINKEADEVIKHILKDEEAALSEIYKQHRKPYLVWVTRHFNVDESIAADIFQDAILEFYLKVNTKKLHSLSCSVNTYLIAIGKNLLLKRHRKDQRIQFVDTFDDVNLTESNLELAYLEGDDSFLQKQVRQALAKIGDKCKDLLNLFYFKQLPHKTIAEQLGYNTVEVARSTKRRCIKKIAQHIGKDIFE